MIFVYQINKKHIKLPTKRSDFQPNIQFLSALLGHKKRHRFVYTYGVAQLKSDPSIQFYNPAEMPANLIVRGHQIHSSFFV